MMQQKFSIVEYYGAGSGHRCGYCKSSSSSFSHGMWAHLLTAQDYQELINRGWRRSGKYCYKPNNKTTCCPLYTIKCDAMNFKLSKTHKKILKRMNRFLKDGKKGECSNDCPENDEPASGDGHETFMTPSNDRAPAAICLVNEIVDMDCADGAVQSSKKVEKSKNENVAKVKMLANEIGEQNTVNSGPDPSKPPCKKAKELRLERKKAKLAEKGLTLPSSNVKSNQEKTLEQFLSEQPDDGVHKLKFTILGVKSAEFAKSVRTEYDLYKKYQTVIHDDPPSDFSEFEEFLVSSPLEIQQGNGAPYMGYGSFHQQYWLDSRLIAVAVIDILPQCVSSVYFFYDPDFAFLSLGTYASLQELALTRELQKSTSDLSNYYMGFYIHSCPKMRYKGKLYPSYLLCPETYTWHLLDDSIRNRLDVESYQRFHSNPDAKDPDMMQNNDVLLIKVLYGRNIMHFGNYMEHSDSDDTEEMLEYGNLVGRSCARRMVIFRG